MVPNEELLTRMTTLVDGWEQCGDARCVFLRCYSMMTANMMRSIAEGRFHDPVWVDHLLHHFAVYYFKALDAYDQGTERVPEVWKRTHDLARGQQTTVMEDLLLGINAHINHDLALAVADMLEPEWATLSPEMRALRYADHNQVNAVIAETIDAVQAEVSQRYARLLYALDSMAGRLDEWKTGRYITAWRNEVWKEAVRIVETHDPATRLALRRALDTSAQQRAELIFMGGELRGRVFGYPVRWLRRLRLF